MGQEKEKEGRRRTGSIIIYHLSPSNKKSRAEGLWQAWVKNVFGGSSMGGCAIGDDCLRKAGGALVANFSKKKKNFCYYLPVYEKRRKTSPALYTLLISLSSLLSTLEKHSNLEKLGGGGCLAAWAGAQGRKNASLLLASTIIPGKRAMLVCISMAEAGVARC